LKKAGAGFGLLALADLLQVDGLIASDIEPARGINPVAPRQPHHPAKANSIIWLFMEGAPSSVDLFDPKPELTKRDGQRIEIDVFNGNPRPLMKSPFSFKQYGQSGAWVCEKYPNVATHVDDFAFIKSLYSESNDHVPALYQINTGIKGGVSYGETDEIGYKAVKDRVSVHDLHATMLHLLGMDHKKLTYFHNGRRYRLTDVAGEVIEKILV